MLKFQELALNYVVGAAHHMAQTARNFTASSRQISRQIFDKPESDLNLNFNLIFSNI